MLYICIFSNKFDLIQAIRVSHSLANLSLIFVSKRSPLNEAGAR
jgi:hypothetical protein